MTPNPDQERIESAVSGTLISVQQHLKEILPERHHHYIDHVINKEFQHQGIPKPRTKGGWDR